ncbi:nucleotidyl transferase AbiEii/AbiGii toxin family protein [Hyphomonas sp.]|uniref:nucleotidyl transferase AbiEii/AbiGii toxin family protein n=1 Tax=Hyphomonas sp. TaxID=87 RepID=UPI0025BC9713|nr:nucleotidyl transferase AbiEii/AbiGii toxin family protein [Hyphomonas sp.]MBI1401034.1 nucleotidyl transferase AbiEii/AbiGii toxin family protein [Hyphomonas sp.]
MKDKPTNLPASISARLRNQAREMQLDMELLLRRYALERLLLRISMSKHSDTFILKGAMLFALWHDDPTRPTRDLDLLGSGASDAAAIVSTFKEICGTEVSDDGLIFDQHSLKVEVIREEQRYGGARVTTTANLGKTRIPIQADIGFGDAVTPAPVKADFPSLLGMETPTVLTYPRETVVAEKFEAIVSLGIANSRMKDFYDLAVLAALFEFDGQILSAAIAATFERRATPLPEGVPNGLSKLFFGDRAKQEQWNAFTRREALSLEVGNLASTIETIAEFVLPAATAARSKTKFSCLWTPLGPWKTSEKPA